MSSISLTVIFFCTAHDNKYFPLLISTSCRYLSSTNTMYHNEAWIEKNGDASHLVVHPDDGANLLIKESTSDTVFVKLSEDVRPGTAHLTHGYGPKSRDPKSDTMLSGISAGKFVSPDKFEEHTGIPLLSGIAIYIEAVIVYQLV